MCVCFGFTPAAVDLRTRASVAKSGARKARLVFLHRPPRPRAKPLSGSAAALPVVGRRLARRRLSVGGSSPLARDARGRRHRRSRSSIRRLCWRVINIRPFECVRVCVCSGGARVQHPCCRLVCVSVYVCVFVCVRPDAAHVAHAVCVCVTRRARSRQTIRRRRRPA